MSKRQMLPCILAVLTAVGHEHGKDHGFATTMEQKDGMVMTTTMTKPMPSIQAKFWLVATIDAGIILLFLMIVVFNWAINRIRRPWLPTQASVAYANGRASWLDLTTLSRARLSEATRSRPPSRRRRRPLLSRCGAPPPSHVAR